MRLWPWLIQVVDGLVELLTSILRHHVNIPHATPVHFPLSHLPPPSCFCGYKHIFMRIWLICSRRMESVEPALASRPPPKSGSDWNDKDLQRYNIKIVYQNTLDFFGISDSELPLPRVHDEVLTVEYPQAAQHDDAYLLLSTMNHVVNNDQGKDSSVVDFTAHLLRVLGYVGRAKNRFTRKRIEVPVSDYYPKILAKPDIAIIDPGNCYQIVLLVQEDKTNLDSSHSTHPEAELIAGAIGAFVSNNSSLRLISTTGRRNLNQVMAGIVMRGTMPVFYKIPITATLVDAVSRGMKPKQETIVNAYIPKFPEPPSDVSVKSFECLESRRVILSCCEAFKKFF